MPRISDDVILINISPTRQKKITSQKRKHTVALLNFLNNTTHLKDFDITDTMINSKYAGTPLNLKNRHYVSSPSSRNKKRLKIV